MHADHSRAVDIGPFTANIASIFIYFIIIIFGDVTLVKAAALCCLGGRLSRKALWETLHISLDFNSVDFQCMLEVLGLLLIFMHRGI